jgi:hypothetical protein
MQVCHAQRQLPQTRGSSWSWSYGNWICNYLFNQCLSPIKWRVRIPLKARCTWYNIMWCILSGRSFLWVLRFPPSIKTDRHDITGMLLKVPLFYVKHTLIIWCMSKTSYTCIHSFTQHISVHSICYEHNRCSHMKSDSNYMFGVICRQQ